MQRASTDRRSALRVSWSRAQAVEEPRARRSSLASTNSRRLGHLPIVVVQNARFTALHNHSADAHFMGVSPCYWHFKFIDSSAHFIIESCLQRGTNLEHKRSGSINEHALRVWVHDNAATAAWEETQE